MRVNARAGGSAKWPRQIARPSPACSANESTARIVKADELPPRPALSSFRASWAACVLARNGAVTIARSVRARRVVRLRRRRLWRVVGSHTSGVMR
jgi:hypothetical protein